MLYELRIYTMYPERLDAIHERFANHTLGIFKRLGLNVYDFWVDAEGEPKLYYIMEYKDKEDRARKWEQFLNDPEWIGVKRNSETGGPIVKSVEEIYMKRAAYWNV